MNYDDVERVFEIVDNARARQQAESGFEIGPVSAEEKAEAYRWVNGQELKHIVGLPGYEIIMAKLNSYMDSGITTLFRNTDPSNEKAVLANFYIGYAACELFDKLKKDIQADLDAAQTVPDIIKQGIRITRGVPINAASET